VFQRGTSANSAGQDQQVKKNRKTRRKPKSPRGTPAADTRTGILFHALPTNRSINVTVTPAGNPSMIFPGRVLLTPPMKSALTKHAAEYWHPGGKEQKARKFDWIINTLADPDRYTDALEYLETHLKTRPMPVFNHPSAVLATRRDIIWKRLSGVENLIAPKCERFTPTHPDHFRAAFDRGGFSYPVLVRPAGSHTGTDLVLIEGDSDWDKVFEISWGGQDIYMTQWEDFQNADGDWPKLRLTITPTHVRLRHILYGDGWLIHAAERDAEKAERELAILLNTDGWTTLQKLGADIRDRVGLDYFGVDLGWKSDTEFVLFEANASMSILSTSNMPTHRQEDYVSVLKLIESDVWEALSNFCGVARDPTPWP
jgi:hypothetical protein